MQKKIPGLWIFLFDYLRLHALDLVGFELHGSLAAKHWDEDFDLAAIFVDLPHFAFEIFEWAVDDDHRFVECEVDCVAHDVAAAALEDLVYFSSLKRYCLICGAHEAGDLRPVSYHAPRILSPDHI